MATGNKLSRLQLKALVKECLLEILQEGLGSGVASQARSLSTVTESRNASQSRQPRRSPLDEPATVHGQRKISNNTLAEAVRATAGGNALMADILADTAMTTLQSQLAGEIPTHGGNNASSRVGHQEQFTGEPADVFGEAAASKWASLAFADVPSKKTA